MLVLIIAKYLLDKNYSDVVQRITAQLLQCFFFALLKIHVASKILESAPCTNKLLKQNSANMEAAPQGCLIITQQRFTLKRAHTVEISYYAERSETRLQTPNNRSLF